MKSEKNDKKGLKNLGIVVGIFVGSVYINQISSAGLSMFSMIIYITFYIIFLLKRKIIIPLINIKKEGIEKIKYYRDELDEYSPMMNAKLLGKDIFEGDVITSMILYLKDKGWNGERKILEDNKKFLMHEKVFIEKSQMIFSYLYKKRKTGKEWKLFKYSIEEFVEEDLKEEGLLKKDYTNNMEWPEILTFLLFMINIPLLPQIIQSNNQNIILITEIIQVIANTMWIIIYYININFKLYFISSLEEKGKVYAEKLRASKRYLQQYTLISDKNIDSELVFGAYVRNAIFFNLKGLLDKSARDYYMSEISKYGYIERKKQNLIFNIIVFVCVYGLWICMFIAIDFLSKLFFANFLIYPYIFAYFMQKLNPRNVK